MIRWSLACLCGVVLLPILAAVALAGSGSNCGTTVTAPGGNIKTGQQIVQYFESQGFSRNAAAGVVGNLQQESGLNPQEAGGGLAQWNPSWYGQMAAYATAYGLSPTSMAGQLAYLAWDIKGPYAGMLAQMNAAPSPSIAALLCMDGYEQCSGAGPKGGITFVAGSLCNAPARQQYAEAAAGGGASGTPVSLGGSCVSVGFNGKDPIPGFTPSRDDMGVDGCANTGMPIFAPATSVLTDIIPDWFEGEPLLLFRFTPPLTGTWQGDEYWYIAEQITPVSETRGTVFQAGQPVAHYASSGTCIEIGWGNPTTITRTEDPTQANPPAGAHTDAGETFKRYFGIPWVGKSP